MMLKSFIGKSTPLIIGMSYLGGKIAYLDSTHEHGFVISNTDVSAGVQWYNGINTQIGYYSSNGLVYGSAYPPYNYDWVEDFESGLNVYGIQKSYGRKNTDRIIQLQGNGTYAATICANLTIGGATQGDWYLPSYGESLKIRDNWIIMGESSYYVRYWTSTEAHPSYTFYKDIPDYSNGGYPKSSALPIRAIRAF